MVLEVELGSGSSIAESFASVAQADAYLSARGQTLWATMITTEKEQALRRGTDYIGAVYHQRWAGRRVNTTQALDWPRNSVPRRDASGYYDSDAVPTLVVNACIEMALRAAAGDLAADLTTPVTSETVGPISVTYAVGGRQSVKYQAIDNMLQPFFKDGGSSISLVRA